jgi:hypothetical protein
MSAVNATPMGGTVLIGNPACKQELGITSDALRSSRDAGVRWIEAETVRASHRGRFLLQPESQIQKFSGTAAGRCWRLSIDPLAHLVRYNG